MSENYRSNRAVVRRNALFILLLDILILGLISSFVAFYRTSELSFHYVDESTHVRATQEMQYTGEYWTPTVFGKNYYNKPPFKMWLSLIPAKLFGQTNFSFRLIDGLTGVFSTVLLYLFARSLFHVRSIAIISALSLITSRAYVFHHGLRTATQDSMANFLNLVSMIVAWKMITLLRRDSSETGKTRRKVLLYAVIGGLSVGCSALTKNVVGYIPIFIIGGFLILSGEIKGVLARGKLPMAIVVLLGLLIPAAYLVPHCMQSQGMCAVMLGDEVVERATVGYHNQTRTLFYLKKLIDRAGPPLELLLPGILLSLGFWIFRKERRHILILVWGIAPLIVFSLVPSRLTWYMVPAFPGLCLMCGLAFGIAYDQFIKRGGNWWRGTSTSLLPTVCFAGFLFFSIAGLAENFLFNIRYIHSRDYFLDIDRITLEIVNTPKLSKLSFIEFGQPYMARNERIYTDRVARKELVPNLEQLKAIINQPDVGFVLADSSNFPDIARLREIKSYQFLAPQNVRNSWAVIISYADNVKFTEKTIRKLTLESGDSASLLYGWSAPQRQGRKIVRKANGDKSSIILKTNKAFEALPSVLGITTAMVDSKSVSNAELDVLINDAVVGEIKVGGQRLRKQTINLPAGSFRSGQSVISIRYKDRDSKFSGSVSVESFEVSLKSGPLADVPFANVSTANLPVPDVAILPQETEPLEETQ